MSNYSSVQYETINVSLDTMTLVRQQDLLSNLPQDVHNEVRTFLNVYDAIRLSMTCRRLLDIVHEMYASPSPVWPKGLLGEPHVTSLLHQRLWQERIDYNYQIFRDVNNNGISAATSTRTLSALVCRVCCPLSSPLTLEHVTSSQKQWHTFRRIFSGYHRSYWRFTFAQSEYQRAFDMFNSLKVFSVHSLDPAFKDDAHFRCVLNMISQIVLGVPTTTFPMYCVLVYVVCPLALTLNDSVSAFYDVPYRIARILGYEGRVTYKLVQSSHGHDVNFWPWMSDDDTDDELFSNPVRQGTRHITTQSAFPFTGGSDVPQAKNCERNYLFALLKQAVESSEKRTNRVARKARFEGVHGLGRPQTFSSHASQ